MMKRIKICLLLISAVVVLFNMSTICVLGEDIEEVTDEGIDITVEPLSATLVSNMTSMEYLNRKISLTGNASGGSGQLLYQFSEEYNGQLKVVRDYDVNNIYSFVTTGIGIHKFYLDVKDSSENTAKAAYEMKVVMHPSGKLNGDLKTNKSSNEYIARNVILTGEHTGGYGTIMYRFRENYKGKTNIVQDYSEQSTYQFRTSGEGNHTYYVDIKDEEGQSVTKSYAMRIVMHPSAKLKGSLKSNKTANEYIWRNITLLGEYTGGYGTIQYRFREKYNGKTEVVQDYSEQSTYQFRTSGEGNHTYYVDIKDEEGQTVTKTYTMKVVMHPSAKLKGSLKSNKTASEYVRRDITLTGEYTGGYGRIQYRFREKYNGKTEIVQDYSEQSTYQFWTKGEGNHTYYVDIKDEEGQTVTKTYVMKIVIHPAAILKGTLKSSKTKNEYIWRDITLTGEHTGGYGQVQYRFREKYNGKTEIVQDYGEQDTYRFRTSGEGDHTFYVDIKDEEGQMVTKTYTMKVVMHPSAKLKGSLVSDKTANEYIQRSIALSGAHTGGYGTVLYEFTEKYNGTEKVVQDYSTNAQYTFMTTGPGIHQYTVNIKDEEGQKISVSWSVKVVVHPTKVLRGTLTNDKTSMEYVRRDVAFTGSHTGGYGEVLYQYRERYKNTEKVVKDYSSNKTFLYRTTKPGEHIFYLDIKDEEGQIITLSYKLNVVVHPSFKLQGNLTKNVNGIVKEGQKIVLTASASAGYGGEYVYRFRELYNGNTKVLQSYDANNIISFNISGSGIHTYYVQIMDCEGQVVERACTISLGKNGWYYENGYKYYYRNDKRVEDVRNIIGPQASYHIKVNKQACCATVYAKDGSRGYIIPVVSFACSPGDATPLGTYYTPAKYRWRVLFGANGQYSTVINGNILFHSVLYTQYGNPYSLSASSYNNLGKRVSHGCVRLRVIDAKWIYDNCKLGTGVTIYNSATPGPFTKPYYQPIPLSQKYDPTDPNI
ncbi:L,D-transpeptidase family protein [[Clostridium] hylemonae]|uniref:L,D-transpeptidase family protein n=1 Tax=[Clostridium] hylemonae TaxID=89153 RepID=UPI001FCA867F|nr:L,D-transpeptidase family protein [[Clostridium] hylemonae]BDF04172.1 hypothetical protein CE91St63_12340 [[Clostridium] hylemonae]